MTSLHPQEYDVTRLVSYRLPTEELVPSVAIPIEPEDAGLFKNEVAVNSYGDVGNNLVNSAPGLWLRVGPAEREQSTDTLVRIGNILVTDDPIEALMPTTPFPNDSATVTWTGAGWFRKTDNAYFVHDGDAFYRVSPVLATEELPGIVEFSTDEEVLLGVREDSVLSPADLSLWAGASELLTRNHSGRRLHLDSVIGDDSLENDGRDPRHPFLSINRAFLEVARQSFVPGFSNDKNLETTIILAPGDYLLDNRPGVTDVSTLARMAANAKGPVNPRSLVALVSAVTVNSDGNTVLTVVGAATAGLFVGSQIWNADATASGIVVTVSDSQIVIREVKGVWATSAVVRFADYAAFNNPSGGVVVPRGCSLVGQDLRKTIVRPRYLGDYNAWAASSSEADCLCSDTGFTSRLLVTGGCYIANLTFADHPTLKETHHLCVAISFASASILADPTYGFYPKVFQVLGNTVSPAMVSSQLEPSALEINIVTDAIDNLVADADQFVKIDSVDGASPYISNCSLLSRFGARGLKADGSLVGGFKSMVIERFTNISLQADSRAFDSVAEAPGGKVYKELWRHASFEALNGGYAQLVSCFTIGSAVHYRARSGGELSLANSFVNFGDIAFDAWGHSLTPFAQDTGAVTARFIPPKPITSSTYELVFANYRNDLSTPTRLYVEDDELQEERIIPFKFLGGETIYLETPGGNVYTAQLVDEAPFFGQDDDNLWYVNVKSANNLIYASGEEADTYFLAIRRTPDTRSQDDRIYWLQVEGLTGEKRAPQRNFILSFNSANPSFTFNSPLWIAKVRDTDDQGQPLGEGVYQIALLNATGINDSINDLYPPLDLDRPNPNPSTSRTYLAMNALLQAIQAPSGSIPSLLTASEESVLLVGAGGSPQTIYLDFVKPSTIRAFGTGLEWVGQGNYSSALPKYQEHSFNLQDLFAKIKREHDAGRVYNVGMTDDGKFVVGDKIIDLTGGDEVDATMPYQETSKVFKNLTVTNRLFMYPNSRLQLGSSSVVFDSDTSFPTRITTDFSVYATQANGGFMRFATQAEANQLTLSNVALAPSTLPIATQTQLGLSQFATPQQAAALSSTSLVLTPGTLPFSSETQLGLTRYSTEAEANLLSLTNVAVTPATLPIGSATQLGLTALATLQEAAALSDLTKVLTPGVMPYATNTQFGLTRYATNAEVDTYQDINAALNPAALKRAMRLLKESEIGVCQLFAGPIAPDGYLLCQGQAVSRATYNKLFAVIGTIWGEGDGNTTFNLPPADRAIIGASNTPGFTLGNVGGSASNTVTTTQNGSHVHLVTILPDGGHTPSVSISPAGRHTPSVSIQPAGGHSHIVDVTPNGAHAHTGSIADLVEGHTVSISVLPDGAHGHGLTIFPSGGHNHAVTDVSMENEHTPVVTAQPDGFFTATITSTLAGSHSHELLDDPAGAHIPEITIDVDGAHDHSSNEGSFTAAWGPWVFSGLYAIAGGGDLPTVSIQPAGGHSHGGKANSSGAHKHYITAGADLPNAGYAGGNGGTEGTTTEGAHEHWLQIDSGGIHDHDVTVSGSGPHVHLLPDMVVPAHAHVLHIAQHSGHTHPSQGLQVDDHQHGGVTDTIASHSHNVAITIPDHDHVLEAELVPAHNHTVTLQSQDDHTHTSTLIGANNHTHDTTEYIIPDHSHTLTITQDGSHAHVANTRAQVDHNHVLTVGEVLDHNHTLTILPVADHDHPPNDTAVSGQHSHQVTVSTIQPYMAMNVIIYTGVYAA